MEPIDVAGPLAAAGPLLERGATLELHAELRMGNIIPIASIFFSIIPIEPSYNPTITRV